jgi:lysophospholipase L1-like esterase
MRRLLVGSLIGGAACAAAVLAIVTASAGASARVVNYVALGDSYSSGTGTGDYTNTACDTGPEGYPSLWDNSHKVASFDFAACSAATTRDVLGGQLGRLSGSTTLVSITIGGNDVGFGKILQTCYLGGQTTCLNEVGNAESYARKTLPGLLSRTYTAIRRAAPNARVVVLDYPHLYGSSGVCLDTLDGAEHSALDHGADVLDGVIASAASKAGFVFADVRRYFNGHGICSSDPWINGLLGFSKGAFHPNATGYQDGYLRALNAAA